MSRNCSHPHREIKIQKWVGKIEVGEEFHARDVAKDLNLLPVEVGNFLKFQDNLRIVAYRQQVGAVWKKVSV